MDLIRFVERATPLRVLGVKVSQHGQLIAEHLWEPDVRRNVYSASKSYTAIAVGLAQAEGLLSLDEKLVDAFPAEVPAQPGEHLTAATVRDLLTMALGQESPFLMGPDRITMPENDWVRATLHHPFTDEPGTRFMYNNAGPYLASVLVQRRAGCNLVDYLYPRLFAPLGCRLPTWEVDPQGCTFGAGGLMLPLQDLHKFGQLMLQDGRWEGKQLVPAEWVRQCTSFQVDNQRPGGYGYLFWGGPEGSWRADGKYGQLSIILREKDAVISVFAECREKGLQEAIFEEIGSQL